jgi:hypothetical protein
MCSIVDGDILQVLILDQHVLAVAVEGAIGHWAAYVGIVTGVNHSEEAKEVARSGTKLPRRRAAELFPSIAKKYIWRA